MTVLHSCAKCWLLGRLLSLLQHFLLAVSAVVGPRRQTFSAYRHAIAASKAGKPIVIVTLGDTRANDLATVRIQASCSGTLVDMAERC